MPGRSRRFKEPRRTKPKRAAKQASPFIREPREVELPNVKEDTPEADIAIAEFHSAMNLLAQGRAAEHTLAVAEHAFKFCENTIDAAIRDCAPPPRACGAGCAFCCSMRVSASVPEILALADFMRRTFGEDDLHAARERIDRHRAQWEALAPKERLTARIPCPLLVENRCSVYEARPLCCRGWNSYDATPCEQNHNQPKLGAEAPAFAEQITVAGAISSGLLAALEAAWLDSHELGLSLGLQIALDQPDAAERWRRGRDVFPHDPIDADYESRLVEKMRADARQEPTTKPPAE